MKTFAHLTNILHVTSSVIMALRSTSAKIVSEVNIDVGKVYERTEAVGIRY